MQVRVTRIAIRYKPSRSEAAVGDQLEETVVRATIKGIFISTLFMSLSGVVFAQGAGGGGGGTAGGTGAGQGGSGMSTPNSNGVTGSTSGASGSSTMRKSSSMSQQKTQKKGATGSSDMGSY